MWPSCFWFYLARLCSLLPFWATLLMRAAATLLEEGQLSAQLEKHRFAYTPVWCSAEGTKYHRHCWSLEFWAMQLFSLWMGIILLHVYKKARRLKELSWPKRLPLTAFKVSLRHLQGWHSRTVQQLKNSILTGSGGGGGGGSLMTWNIETMGEI